MLPEAHAQCRVAKWVCAGGCVPEQGRLQQRRTAGVTCSQTEKFSESPAVNGDSGEAGCGCGHAVAGSGVKGAGSMHSCSQRAGVVGSPWAAEGGLSRVKASCLGFSLGRNLCLQRAGDRPGRGGLPALCRLFRCRQLQVPGPRTACLRGDQEEWV